jgi:hypothetical protein
VIKYICLYYSKKNKFSFFLVQVSKVTGIPMDAMFELIQKLSAERFELNLLAGKQHLSPAQKQRRDELDGELPKLWDQHRSQLAASSWVGHTVVDIKPKPPKKVATTEVQAVEVVPAEDADDTEDDE